MFNVLKFNNISDIEAYRNIVANNNFNSAYLSFQYFEVFSGGIEDLMCFVYAKDDRIILLPGYKKHIKIYNNLLELFDFFTPYGYTGAFYSENVSEEELEDFWNKVDDWYLKNNVISEFVRFSLFNNYKKYTGHLQKTMLNVKGRILAQNDQWEGFEQKVRKNVKRAQRENLTSKIYYKNIDKEIIAEFHDIYIKTMKRTNAKDSFFYSLESFEYFVFNNAKLCLICTIYDDLKPISTELLLISNQSIFSFLGGTIEESFDKRPNDYLKFEVINWARENNFENYILGGGYGYEDGIFKYKKAFFPNDVVEYITGRKILNKELYSNLVNDVNIIREKKNLEFLELNDDSYFPLYNKQ